MTPDLVLLENNHHLFFNILPEDWQENIVPFWDDYKSTSKVFVFFENNQVIAGGIIFGSMPPDLKWNGEALQKWFDHGFLYIGFLWVAEDYRNLRLGSLWLEKIKDLMPNQNFWLVIEEENLGNFYKKHHFQLEQTIHSENGEEWLYTFNAVN